jgi:hypothetical protein
MTATTAMLPDFPKWYASLGLGKSVDLHQLRWTAVSAIVSTATPAMIEGLLRLAFATKQPPSDEVVNALRAAIHEADPPATLDNARELQVFAGSVLAALMVRGSGIGARAAMAVTTTAGYGRSTPDLPMDLFALANAHLSNIANAMRKRTPITIQNTEIPIDLAPVLEKAAGNNWQPVNEAFSLLTPALQKPLQTLVARQASLIQAINAAFAVQDEELNILWWVIGGYSRDLQEPFANVPNAIRPLIFAKELSDLTVFLPGPASAVAVLSRSGLDEHPSTIAGAVNGTSADWTRPLVKELPASPISTPVHFAIERELETGAGTDWLAGWSATTQLDPNAQITSLTLGTLFYRERLLLRPSK